MVSAKNTRPMKDANAESPNAEREFRQAPNAQTDGNGTNNIDNIDLFIQIFLDASKRLWFAIKEVSSFVMVEMGGYQLFDKSARWCIRHPHITICLLAGGFVSLIPFLILTGFAISTVVMTFTGFLVLEGTLLTIISMVLLICFGALAIVLIFFAIVVVAAYFGFAHIYDLYGNGNGRKSVLMDFLMKEKPKESETKSTSDTEKIKTNIENL